MLKLGIHHAFWFTFPDYSRNQTAATEKKIGTEQWAKNLFELAPSPNSLQAFSLKSFYLTFSTWCLFLCRFVVCCFLFGVFLSLPCFLLHIKNTSSRMRRGETALCLGSWASSSLCEGEATTMCTPQYVKEITANYLFSCNYIEVDNCEQTFPQLLISNSEPSV